MKQLRLYIRRIGLILCALFVLLILYSVYSLSNYGSRWFSTSANTWLRSAKKDVIPGDVYDVNGILLAGSAVADTPTGFTAVRKYPDSADLRRAMVHVLGDSAGKVSNGVETFMARALYGFNQGMPERIRDFVSGARRKGDSLTLTVDSKLCTYILNCVESLPDASGKGESPRGAVVVMNWKTGAVLAEMSFPTFDPADAAAARQIAGDPYTNRATQGLYAPGATFKVVTAAAVLTDPQLSGRSFTCTGSYQAADSEGQTLQISDAETSEGEVPLVAHGQIDLRRAFRLNCSTTFAAAAVQLTDAKLRRQAMTFGFDENFLFRDIVLENSSYPDQDRSVWALALTGVGQGGLQATPMHLCLIASAVANGGVMMEPRLVARSTASSGAVRRNFTSQTIRKLFDDPAVADTLREYMDDAVNAEGGTAREAALTGWRVCGQAAGAGGQGSDALFIGFLDDEQAPYAISIVLEDRPGGNEAASLAHDIFEYLILYIR